MPPAIDNSSHEIFDNNAIRQHRNRARANFEDYNFLVRWCNDQLLERLGDISRNFENILILGGRDADYLAEQLKAKGGQFIVVSDMAEQFLGQPHETRYTQAREDYLPFARNSFDLVISSAGLHCINDLPGALIQINRVLKPDGAFLGSFPGGDTLNELRYALSQAELNIAGGVSPRIFPMADKQDAGALLQRAGFSLPVVDSDILTVTYENAIKLLKDLRGMGEANALKNRHKRIPPRRLFSFMDDLYKQNFSEADQRIPATFEFIFMIGWAPHDSQQKPLKPGSAKNRLADALGTEEHNL